MYHGQCDTLLVLCGANQLELQIGPRGRYATLFKESIVPRLTYIIEGEADKAYPYKLSMESLGPKEEIGGIPGHSYPRDNARVPLGACVISWLVMCQFAQDKTCFKHVSLQVAATLVLMLSFHYLSSL